MRFKKLLLSLFLLAGATLLMPRQARAQGCILTRSMSPVLGAQVSPYLQKGEWQVGASYRNFKADTQYLGTTLEQPISSRRTNVISKMNYSEMSVSYAPTQQWNVAVGVPVILLASSNRALPAAVTTSPRYIHSSSGLGDIMVGARYWFMDCNENPDRNFSIGFGLKTPTGDSNVQDVFPNANGTDARMRPVDQSIQLGDSGWGLNINFEAFTQLGPIMVFGSGGYLFNPQNKNDTLSPPALLNPVGPQAVDERFRYNTISDSYLWRAGVGSALPKVPGAGLSLALRMEGVPVTDLLGDSEGFRRPGYYLSLEPGVNFSHGKATWALSAPIRLKQDVSKDTYGVARSSTFADHMLIMSVSYRFGGDYAQPSGK